MVGADESTELYLFLQLFVSIDVSLFKQHVTGQSMQPDLAKFGPFFVIFKLFGNFWGVRILQKITHAGNFCAIVQIFIVINGQILKNNLAIWSHCNSLASHITSLFSRQTIEQTLDKKHGWISEKSDDRFRNSGREDKDGDAEDAVGQNCAEKTHHQSTVPV